MPNLQLLEGGENESKNKTPLLDRIMNEDIIPDLKKYKSDNFIPKDVDLSFDNFKIFFNERRVIIKKRLKEIFRVTEKETE